MEDVGPRVAGHARCLIATLVLAALAPMVRAQAPPPDPSRGERSDARIESRDTRQFALWVPRLVLMPLRLLLELFAYPTEPVLAFIESHNVSRHVHDATTTPDGLRGVRPEVMWSLSFAFAGGLDYFDQRSLGVGTSLGARLVAGGANIIESGISLRPTPSRWRSQVRLSVDYAQRDDLYFNGIGQVHVGSRYGIRSVNGVASLRTKVGRMLSLGIGAQSALKRFVNGDPRAGNEPIAEVYCVRVLGRCVDGVVDPRQVPGFDRGTQYARGVADFVLDTRDNGFEPRAGFFVSGLGDYTHGLGFDESSYFRITGSAGAAVSVWQRSHTFVLRGTVSVVEPINDVPVPFSELLVLGGPDTLRGFLTGSFRDESLLWLTAEYRWPIWMYADGSLFADWGGTFARNFGDFKVSGMRWDIGAALRVTTRSQFFLRLGIAYGFGDGGGVQLFFSGNSGS
jgi:outer membrane protein assembly factor BamA